MKLKGADFIKGIWIKIIILFFISLSIAGLLIALSEKVRLEYLQRTAINLAAEQGVLTQRQLNQALSAVYAVAALVYQGKGQVDNFESLAGDLLSFYDCMSSLQLAPKAVVSQIVPLEGNEKAIGHNLLADKLRAPEIQEVLETKKFILFGPYELIQGGQSVVGRLPIFLEDPEYKDNQQFWGLVVVTIRIDRLLQAASFHHILDSGYDYELSSLNPQSNDFTVFARSSEKKLTGASDFIFEVPNGKWNLTINPQKGWLDYPLLAGKILLAVLLSVAIARFGYSVFMKPILLQREVDKRTQELAKANEALKISYDRMQYLAHYDSLTNIPNRTLFSDRLSYALKTCKRQGTSVALLYIDLDFFKSINDDFGHAVGDELLKQAVDRMVGCIRATDSIGRLGGDEFAVLLPDLAVADEAKKVAEKIRKVIELPFNINGKSHSISASIGVAIYPDHAADEDSLIKAADQAMYHAKQTMRNRVVFYSCID